jgi:redox-regulated HSP33 family molecular chaperone
VDVLKKFIVNSQDLQLSVIDAKVLVATSMERTEAWPPATIHLGQALMSQALLTSILTKETEGKLSLQWSSQGPFGGLYVEGQPTGQTRGTISKPQAPVQNMYAGMGPGQLQVRKAFQHQSQGIIRSRGDVCSDVLHYLEQSEQRQCAMNLWVDLKWNEQSEDHPVEVQRALGFLLEALPAESSTQGQLKAAVWEARLNELGSLSSWQIPEQNSVNFIADQIFEGVEKHEILHQKVYFDCPCSEERAERALTLAVQQTGDPREDSEEIRCEFCGKVYTL